VRVTDEVAFDRVSGVILAAGASTRFGTPKQRARIGETTMLEAVVEIARRAGLAPILAVVPPGLAVPPDVVPVINADPDAGLSRSFQLGIAAVPVESPAVVVLLGDQPTLDPDDVRAIVAGRGRQPVVVAEADGLLAPPVLIEREAFGLADEVSGDAGLRDWLRANRDRVAAVSVRAHPPDVDTPDDLASLDR
jgi:molybdenum cofactor cytidylyltransferase